MVGLLLAIVGFIGVVVFAGRAATGAQLDVVVAAHDIPLRAQLAATDLQVVKFNSNDVPPGAYTNARALTGMIAAVPFQQGQPILRNLVSTSATQVVTGATSYLPIPPGFVAVTIPSAEQQGVAGYIQPGDYISIIAVVTPSGSRFPVARTVFTNVHVIRVGPAEADSNNPQGTLGNARAAGVSSSLTVVASECDAEYLSWFLNYATIRYTLESYQDYQSAPASDRDPTCPSVTAAHGATGADVQRRWPGLLTTG